MPRHSTLPDHLHAARTASPPAWGGWSLAVIAVLGWLWMWNCPVLRAAEPAEKPAAESGADTASAPSPIDYVGQVRPILQRRCYACHGEQKQKGSLRLDIKSEAFRGGDNYGPAIIAGRAADSPLVQRIAEPGAAERMPPESDPLPPAEIALLTRWIDSGAHWPEGVDLARLVDKRDHWSFRPPQPVSPPEVRRADWPLNEIDRFVLARLESHGLSPAPPVEKAAWLRRVSFDLIGLPPSPEELAEFLADQSDAAYPRVVERLLASPRYGERWAQHWLDVVRYADTHGFEVNTERPHAWPYRDYVIDALNRDTPYDQFVREQIAGDALGQDAATGFLVTASVLLPGQIGKDAPSIRLARQDALDDILINLGQTFLGLSIGCARCHDHKFDPITHHDYFGLQGFVAGVEYEDRPLRTAQALALAAEEKRLEQQLAEIQRRLAALVPLAETGEATAGGNPTAGQKSRARRPAVNARHNVDRFAPVKTRRIRFTVLATNRLEPCLDELEAFDLSGNNAALASLGTKVHSSGSTVVADRHELRFVNDGQYGNPRSWLSDQMGGGWVELEFPRPVEIDRVVWSRDRQGKYDDRLPTAYRIEAQTDSGAWRTVATGADRAEFNSAARKPAEFSTAGLAEAEVQLARQLLAEKKQLEPQLAASRVGQVAFAGTFRRPDVVRLLSRGDPEQPQAEVQPAVPAFLGSLSLPPEATEQQRRQALAQWIARADHPLTARVMVNRIWQGHFGTGLVATPSDFGRNGALPSHPELLDWLARQFVRDGWSLKQMHRRIVLSATYRQASQYQEQAAQVDAEARLLWRFPRRRLEAEAIRNAMLTAAGRLNLKMYGPGFDLFDKRGGLTGFQPIESFSGDGLRRMIYAHKVRREREAVFGAFDCPDGGQSAAKRRESTTPIQALNLLNSRFTLEQSEALAARIRQEVGQQEAARGEAEQREAGQRDVDLANLVDRAYRLTLGRPPDEAERAAAALVVRQHGLPPLCRALFNSNEFLFWP